MRAGRVISFTFHRRRSRPCATNLRPNFKPTACILFRNRPSEAAALCIRVERRPIVHGRGPSLPVFSSLLTCGPVFLRTGLSFAPDGGSSPQHHGRCLVLDAMSHAAGSRLWLLSQHCMAAAACQTTNLRAHLSFAGSWLAADRLICIILSLGEGHIVEVRAAEGGGT